MFVVFFKTRNNLQGTDCTINMRVYILSSFIQIEIKIAFSYKMASIPTQDSFKKEKYCYKKNHANKSRIIFTLNLL